MCEQDDLAGHHVVMRLEKETEGANKGEPVLTIHKLPLVSSASVFNGSSDRMDSDPAEMLYQVLSSFCK